MEPSTYGRSTKTAKWYGATLVQQAWKSCPSRVRDLPCLRNLQGTRWLRMIAQQSDNWRELALGSILTSPFLLFSLCFHVLIGFALAELLLSIGPRENNLSIPINLIEFGVGKSIDKSIGSRRGPGGPRNLPQQGTPVPPREARGKVDSGSTEAAAPEGK